MVRKLLELIRKEMLVLLRGRQTIPIALAKGKIDKEKANELNAVLSQPGR